MKTKACGRCGTEFERKHIAEKYCSDTCRMDVIRERAALASATPERKEAARASLKRYRDRLRSTPEGRAKLASYRKPKPPREPKIKTCGIFGSGFQGKHNSVRYCGDECRAAASLASKKRENAKYAEKLRTDPVAHRKHREYMNNYMRERTRRLREQKANSLLTPTAQIKANKDATATA